MTEHAAAEGLDRRDFLIKAALGAGIATAALASPGMTGVARGDDDDGDRRRFQLDVLADLEGLNFSFYDGGPLAGDNPGPFYIPGDIFPHGATNIIGDFHCWGFFFEADGALGVVSQEYNLTGRGKIQVQGVEDEGPRAVTGGTGNFRRVRGEMTGADLSAFPFFTVTFRLRDVDND